jgi:hypothetical protein
MDDTTLISTPSRIRKILIIGGIALAAVPLLAAIVAAAFEKPIGSQIIAEVNKQLSTELKVREFNLSLLRGFPNVSAELLGVSLLDTRKKNLLQADRLTFRFGLFSLFKTKKLVRSCKIEKGTLSIYVDERGKANYDIFKKSKKASAGSDFELGIEKAELRNVSLDFQNRQSAIAADILVENAVFNGEFSARSFWVESMAKLTSRQVTVQENRYLVDKDIGYAARILAEPERGLFNFYKFDLALERTVFHIDGTVERSQQGTDFDLAVNCGKGNIESIVQLLPEQYQQSLGDFSGRGDFAFEATVLGRLGNREWPKIQARMGLKNGRISSPRMADDLKNVSFNARFYGGNDRQMNGSYFTVQDFQGYFGRELIELSFRADQLKDPRLDIRLDGTLPLGAIYGLLSVPTITGGDGEIGLKNLHIAGRYRDLIDPAGIARVEASGELILDDAAFEINGEKMVLDRGSISLLDNVVVLRDLNLNGAGSDITLSGEARNLLPVLFADSLNSQQATLEFQSSLSASVLDLKRLVALTEIPGTHHNSGNLEVQDSLQRLENQRREQFTSFLKGTFQASVERFSYGKIQGDRFRGDCIFDNNLLRIRGEAFGMEGSFDLDGYLYFEARPRLEARLECNEINIKDFFAQAENFGQRVLRDDHLEGILTSRMYIQAYWDERGNFLHDKLHVYGAVSIENGELLRMEMLGHFSDFIHMQDLRHIRFVDMENWFEVRDRKVFVPVMYVRSNALNLAVSGIHTFDQVIDYNFKFNAAQTLINRLKPHNPNLEPQKSQKKNWFNLYYNIRGPLEKYQVELARARVKKAFDASERQKRAIQAKLFEVFGPFELIDEPEDWKDAGQAVTLPSPTKKEDEDEYIEGF